MKRVLKSGEPDAFIDWKAKANEMWQPSYAALQNPEKRVLHEALLIEQGWVCCYCGRVVSLTSSHIEHYRPQEAWEGLALDYINLHASCIRETEPGAPLHCGHAKASEFDERKAISPQDTDCERRFIYSAQNGAVYPADRGDESAAYMIGLLKLDLKFLRDRRSAALKSAFDDEFVQSASDEDLTELVRAYLRPDTSGRMTDFGHVLSRYAEQLLKQKNVWLG